MNNRNCLMLIGALVVTCNSAILAAGSALATAPNCEAFRAWRLPNATGVASLTATQVAEGVSLAKARRLELKAMIQHDPRSALGWAVTATERAALPKEIAGQLETEISGIGYVGALMADPATESNTVPSVSMTVHGQVLRVFLHGSQLGRTQWYGEAVKGVAIDSVAVMEDPAGVAALAAPVIRTATKTLTRAYEPGRIKVTRVGDYDQLELEGVAYLMTGELGTPGLPSEVINVALPPGVEVKGIRTRFWEQVLRDEVIPWPIQRPLPVGAVAATNFIPPDADAYGRSNAIPEAVAALAGDRNRYGHRYVSVMVNPLRYVGATRTLYVVTNVVVEVDYELPLIASRAPADVRIEEARTSVRSLVINPDEVQSPAATTPLDFSVTGTGSNVDYLIITTDALAPAFTNLAAHRQAYNGFTTEIRTVANITNTYSGVGVPAKIRACITDYFQTRQTAYVVLGGDNAVPAYYENTAFQTPPTDLYYSGLDGSRVDMGYDVVVGRIPVRTVDQVNAYVSKVIAYDDNPPYELSRKMMLCGRMLWFGAMWDTDSVYDGHLQFAQHYPVSDGEVYTRRGFRDFVQPNGNAYKVGCMFDSLTSWDLKQAGEYQASGSNLAAKLSLGWNVAFNFTHGDYQVIVAEGDDDSGADSFSLGLASTMTNTLVAWITGACSSGAFDWVEPSMSEAMLRNPNGGSLVYLGTSRVGWGPLSGYPDTHPYRFYGGVSPLYDAYILQKLFVDRWPTYGKAFAEAKLALSPQCTNTYLWDEQCMLNFQGDPALGVLGAKPCVTLETVASVTGEGGNAPGRIMVSRDPAISNLTVSLCYTGTATGADIVESLPTTLTFTNGESQKVITVTPVDDGLAEGTETLTVTVTPGALYEPGSLPATLTILDHTNLPVVSMTLTGDTLAEWSNSLSAGSFTLTNATVVTLARSGDTNAALTLWYLVSGTAPSNDYVGVCYGTGCVTFAAGQVSTSLTVTAVDNAYYEGDRTLSMNVLHSQDYIIYGAASRMVTILDEEPLPAVSVAAPDATAREHSADTGTFRITRTGDTTLPLAVSFTVGGTCAANRYLMPASPVTIPSGSASVDLAVTPLDDQLMEPQQGIVLTLSASDGYTIGASTNATVTLYDDDNLVPSISLSGSPTSYEVGDTVTLAATASDDWGVSNVSFYISGVLYARDATMPYQYNWTGRIGSNTITAVVTDLYGVTNAASTVVVGSALPKGPGTGFLAEWWTNLVGTGISSLTNDTKYIQNQPDGSMVCPTNMTLTLPNTNAYGLRFRAFLIPPKDGYYRLNGSGYAYDSLVTFLSTDESPANKAVVSSQTPSVYLRAGRRYYLEALFKHDRVVSWAPTMSVALYYYDSYARQLVYEFPIPYHRLEPWCDLGVVADTNAVTVPEGGTAQFQVSLDQAPTGTVNVTVSRVGGDPDISVQGPTNLVFDAGTWNIPQAVTLAAAEDADTAGGQASIICASPMARAANVTAIEADHDSNTPPVAAGDSYPLIENASLDVAAASGVLANDTDAETNTLWAALVGGTSNGVLSLNADGSFIYTPNTGWSGTDSFTYKANDGQTDSVPATVTLTVLTRPDVASVMSPTNLSEVIVCFDRAVKTTPAETVSNYAIDQGVSVISVQLGYDQQTARLVVSGLAAGPVYTLTVNNMADMYTGVAMLPDTRASFMFGNSMMGGVFPLPYQDTYEPYDRGSNLVGAVWTVLSSYGAQAAVGAGAPVPPACGYPASAATHTNALAYYGQIALALDGTTTSNLMTVALDTMIQPCLGPCPTGDALVAMTNGQVALYFDTNGFVNVFRGVRASAVAGPPDSTAWLALTNCQAVQTGEWHRLTVVMNYDLAGPMVMFQVALDSNVISAAEGYAEASVGSSHGGSWLISPKWDDADLRLHMLTLGGGGWVDDLTLTPGAVAQFASNNVPVTWMQAAGLSTNMDYPTWDAMAMGDPDHDGLPTWQEYISGTDPSRASSVLRIATNSVDVSGANIILSWPSASGRIYAIQRTTNLVGQAFGDVWTGISATPPVNTYTGSVSGSGGAVFYRIIVNH